MTKIVLFGFVFLLSFGTVSEAQTSAQVAAKEAEIRASVPYSTMVAKVPGMTLEQYRAAIRRVALDELRSSSIPATPALLPPTYPSSRTSAYSPSTVSSTTSRIGQFGYYSDSTGVTGTSTQIGSYRYSNYSNGVSTTTTRIPPTTYYTVQQPTVPKTTTGTTTTIGQFQFHNFSNGVTGSTTQIGQFGFTNLSNGKRCTTTTIGNYTYTNCY